MDLVAALGRLTCHQLLAVPRRTDADAVDVAARGPRAPARRSTASDVMRAGLAVALTGAYHDASPVAVLWLRRPPAPDAGGATFEVYVGSARGFGGRPQPVDGQTAVLFPVGSLGRPVAAQHVMARLTSLPSWTRCLGGFSSHLVAAATSPTELHRAPFEDYVTAAPIDTFAWLVVAEPVAHRAVMEELADSQLRLYHLQGQQDGRFRLESAQAGHRELLRARATGLWRVHVLVGAATDPEAQAAAGLLCAGSDLAHQPYALVPQPQAGPLGAVAAVVCGAGRIIDTDDEPDDTDDATAEPDTPAAGLAWPFEGSTDLLASIARPPEHEIPGLRAVDLPSFDVTPELPASGIRLGRALDGSQHEVGSVHAATDTLNRHTFVCGATGSGKSQTVRGILEELSGAGIPWLVIEPAKAEYARMAGRLATRAGLTGSQAAVHRIRPGDPTAAPASLNPLEPEPGFPLQTHVDLVRALFLAAFEAEEPFPQVLAAALSRCYADIGWDLTLGRPQVPSVVPRYPTLGDLQSSAKVVVAGIGYGREVTDNVRGFVDVRIGSLRLGTPGRFFEGGHPLDVAALLRRNVVLEIQDVGSDEDKAFLIGTVLIRLAECLRVRCAQTDGPVALSHVTVVEEAHRLLKNTRPGTPSAHAVELFASLLAEIRAYGEGIIVAEQIPAKVLPDVVKNSALKIMHRLPAQDDRDTVGATMNLDRAQSHYVVTLGPGTAAVFADGMDRPILTRMPLGEAREAAQLARRDVPLARVRGPGCGAACHQRGPCTLEQIVEAARLAEDAPHDGARVAIWLEVLVVAHLIGLAAPRPARAWLQRVAASSRRHLECAIGYAAQAAVDARYSSLVRTVQPESLVVHARDCALAAVDGVAAPCSPADVVFQTGPYRWMDVRRELENAQQRGLEGAHPLTDVWRESRGLLLAGTTVAAQLESLWSVPELRQPSDPIVFGPQMPSRLETLLCRSSHATDPAQVLREALDHLDFGDNDWPSEFLVPRTVGPAG